MSTMTLTLNKENKIEIFKNKVKHSGPIDVLGKTIYDSYLELKEHKKESYSLKKASHAKNGSMENK
ncbi:hypothetical protein NHG28_06610 [Aerococcaceae bacterium NML201209]|nr:hypothetical protein [Aerococcaceae bacterium NML201209]